MENEATDKPTILIVDDDVTNLEILSEYLGQSEFTTLTAQSGEAALQLGEQTLPDLILMDVMMPHMDGFETCRHFKEKARTKDVPVIFITAMTDMKSKAAGFKAGGIDYITKPFHHEEVLIRVRTHLTLRQQQQQLQRQTEQLAELNASKDRFLSMIAHDLRSPFSTLRLLIGVAAESVEGKGQEELEKIITLLQKSSENLYTLLENLLAWSRIQRGVMKYRPQQLDLQKIVLQNLALAKPYAEQKQIVMANEIHDSVSVYADHNMVDAVIRNLLSNAIKFTYPGGTVTLSIASHDKRFLVMSVADTGIGIETDNLKKLFRIDASLKRKGTAREQGSGLGLILCKEFIEKNGGRIWVESNVNTGSTFRFTLPQHPDA